MNKAIFAPLLAVALVLPACSSETTEVDGQEIEVQDTVLNVLGDTDDVATLTAAIESTGLNTLFDAPGASYTILAPTDEAFAALGNETPEPAVMAAILREHILPGHLEASAIVDAVKANNGAITMASVGNGNIEFTLDGDTLVAKETGSGKTARLTGGEGLANNGAVLVVDTVLATPPDDG